MMSIFDNKKSRQATTVWTCPLCNNIEHTTDPGIVRLHCPGCCECSWMIHDGENDGGQEEKNASEGE